MQLTNTEITVCHDEHKPLTYIYIWKASDHTGPVFTISLDDKGREWLIKELQYYDSVEYDEFKRWKDGSR